MPTPDADLLPHITTTRQSKVPRTGTYPEARPTATEENLMGLRLFLLKLHGIKNRQDSGYQRGVGPKLHTK
jgi:hypothetical protein